MRVALLPSFICVLLLQGCPKDSAYSVACTHELRTAVTVNVSSPMGLPIDSVTAGNPVDRPCEPLSAESTTQDAGGTEQHWCFEAGGGTYVVTVTSGDMTWTQETTIRADECHTIDHKTLTFVLDPATAD